MCLLIEKLSIFRFTTFTRFTFFTRERDALPDIPTPSASPGRTSPLYKCSSQELCIVAFSVRLTPCLKSCFEYARPHCLIGICKSAFLRKKLRYGIHFLSIRASCLLDSLRRAKSFTLPG